MIPFKEKWYYVPEMQGSYSIKKVLPSLVPDLNYDRLNINKGDLASIEFMKLGEKSMDDQKKIRTDLLEYCKMDTFAMYKIFKIFKKYYIIMDVFQIFAILLVCLLSWFDC